MESHTTALMDRHALEALFEDFKVKFNELQKAYDAIIFAGFDFGILKSSRQKQISVAGRVVRFIEGLPSQAEFSTDDIVSFLERQGLVDSHKLRINVSRIVCRLLTRPGGVSRIRQGYFVKD